jgi:hypothetical protein
MKAYFPPYTPETLMYLVQNANIILSKDIDYLLSVFVLGSDAKIISSKFKNPYNVINNKYRFKYKNKVFVDKDIQPIDILEIIKKD